MSFAGLVSHQRRHRIQLIVKRDLAIVHYRTGAVDVKVCLSVGGFKRCVRRVLTVSSVPTVSQHSCALSDRMCKSFVGLTSHTGALYCTNNDSF